MQNEKLNNFSDAHYIVQQSTHCLKNNRDHIRIEDIPSL